MTGVNLYDVVGRAVERLREAEGLTRAELAERLAPMAPELTANSIKAIERGSTLSSPSS